MTGDSGPLGDTPEKWRRTRLGRYVKFRNGKDAAGVEDLNGDYPVFGSGGEFRRASQYLFDGESVLFGRKGTIDRPLHVRGRFWTVDTMFYTDIDKRSLMPRFLYYWATCLPYERWQTNTALPSMTSADLSGAPLPLPSVPVQVAIADYLDRETAEIDAFIADQEELIALLEERERVALREMFFVQETASMIALRRVAKSKSGAGFPPELQGRPDQALPFYKVNSLNKAGKDGVIRFIEDSISMDEAERLHARIFPPGTVVMAKIGAAMLLGRARSLAVPSCIDNNMVGFTFSSGVLGAYMRHLLELSFTAQLANPGTIPTMNDTAVLSLSLPVPPVEKQQLLLARAAELELSAGAAIADAREAIALSKERRAALISAAVTGQIDVTEKKRVLV